MENENLPSLLVAKRRLANLKDISKQPPGALSRKSVCEFTRSFAESADYRTGMKRLETRQLVSYNETIEYTHLDFCLINE